MEVFHDTVRSYKVCNSYSSVEHSHLFPLIQEVKKISREKHVGVMVQNKVAP